MEKLSYLNFDLFLKYRNDIPGPSQNFNIPIQNMSKKVFTDFN